MNDVPTLNEEINRKALEALSEMISARDNGRITKAQMHYGIHILWTAVAGLVDKDVMAMIESLYSEKRDASFYERVYLRKNGAVGRLTNMNDGRVRMEVFAGDSELPIRDKTVDFRNEENPYKCGKEKFQSVIEKLVLEGFSEI